MKKTAKISEMTRKGFNALVRSLGPRTISLYALYCAGFKQGYNAGKKRIK